MLKNSSDDYTENIIFLCSFDEFLHTNVVINQVSSKKFQKYTKTFSGSYIIKATRESG